MRALALLAALVLGSGLAAAAPAADLVVVWAPGVSVAPVEAAARQHGAAVIDRSPAPSPSVETAQFLQRGITAYNALQLDEAQRVLDQARDLVDRTGAAGVTTAQLSDLFLYRGLVKAAQGDAAAWDELLTAIVIDPTRDLDPARFPPKVKDQLARARDTVKNDRKYATLAVDAPPGCTVYVDATAVAAAVSRLTGPHWVRVDCNDHAPWGTRVDLTTLDLHIAATPAAYAPPGDADVIIQARTAGARAVIVAEVHNQVGTARLVDVTGKEKDRRTVKVIGGDLAPLAEAVTELLTPPLVTRRHWYQSKWAWAAGAAAITAAILVPLTAVIASDTGSTTATAHLKWPGGVSPL